MSNPEESALVVFPKIFNDFVEIEPISDDFVEITPIVGETIEPEVAKLAKGKIPPRENVAPPPPKPFDAALSIPPEIGSTQSLPPLRVTCLICKSTDKGVPPPPHDCSRFQGV